MIEIEGEGLVFIYWPVGIGRLRKRHFEMMRKLASLMLLLPFASECHAEFVQVVDGDEVLIDGQLARLADVDAPETCQPGGKHARAALTSFLHGDMTYESVGLDEDGIQQVRLYANGREINQLLVQSGWAQDATKSSPSRYAFAEAVARMDKIGIWSRGQQRKNLEGHSSCS